MKKIELISIVAVFLLTLVRLNAQQLAFPTAEGYGKYAKGGRGGVVVEVTNLNDSGAGSFRDAVQNKIGPRTIVFRVGGIIDLKSQVTLRDDAYVTIAGQTAPGGGICIRNFPLMIQGCQHIVVRYLRSRLGDFGTGEDDALSVRTSRNVILDHCSLGWSIDSILDITHNSGDVTVQYCIMSEALVNSRHVKGSHGYAAGWDGKWGASYHHNLIAHCVSRTPRLDSYLNDDGTKDLIEIANNVIFNWSSYGAYGGENANVNWQNNYYRYGPETPLDRRSWIFGSGADNKMYVNGNYVYAYPSVTADNSLGINYAGKTLDQVRSDVLMTSPFKTMGIEMQTAEDAYRTVLANVGAILPIRDAVDHRIIKDVMDATGGYIDSQDEVGGWPVYEIGVALLDTDHDGMPDTWEDNNSLNKNDAADRNGDLDADGYTNLEEYMNSLVTLVDPSTIPLPPIPVQSVAVTVDGNSDTIPMNKGTVQLFASVLPENAGIKEIEWSISGGSSVATIDVNGLLTPVAPGKAIVKALSKDGSGIYGFITLIITKAVLSNQSALNEIKVFPNPTSDYVTIDAIGAINQIQLLNLNGSIISEYADRKIDLSNISKGMYFLNVQTQAESRMIRVIKN
jgi:pectate lyase